jgi:hypothetical protein
VRKPTEVAKAVIVDSLVHMKPERPKVVDLQKRRYAKLVLSAYDRLAHQAVREHEEKRSEVERENKKKW